MPEAFDLLETLQWTPARGFFLIDRHLSRMMESARHFGYAYDAGGLRAALERAVRAAGAPQRVRLLLSRDGAIRVERADLRAVAMSRVVLAQAPVDRADASLYHKTTNRALYDEAKRPFPAGAVDDVILWNTDGQVTESTIANVVVEIDGRKVTPPVHCGLLGGTFRAQLLEDGAIHEGIITVDQLRARRRLWLINSVREWWPAELDDATSPRQ